LDRLTRTFRWVIPVFPSWTANEDAPTVGRVSSSLIRPPALRVWNEARVGLDRSK
jgi:hypothetical protein